jgi:SGNH domain (fused to AT3 domains)
VRGRESVPVVAFGIACVLAAACSSAASQTSTHPPARRVEPAAATATVAPTTAVAPATTTTIPVLHRALAAPRPLRILVVGDSVARTFGAGLTAWAREAGGAVVLDDSRDWCSLGRSLPRNVFGPQNASAGCDDWGTRWANDVATFDPDVVLVMFTIWEVVPRELPGTADFVQPGNAALDAWQLSEYRDAADVLSARGAPVVWFNVACEGTRIRRGEPLWFLNRRTLPALARSRTSVRLIDIDGLLCNGPRLLRDLGGVHDIRPDGAHYSAAGALAVARWVMRVVVGAEPAPPYAAN